MNEEVYLHDGKGSYSARQQLVAVTIVALAGISFLPEVFVETELPHKVDDAGLFLIGIAAIAWYLIGRNKFTRSLIPLLFVLGSLAFKFIGFALEIADKDDIGDEYGALILLVLASLFVGWLYFNSRKVIAAE